MADKDHLVKSTEIHSPTQRTHVFLAVGSIQCPHRFVPEQRFVTNALTLPGLVDGEANDGFVDPYILTKLAKSTQASLGMPP